MPVAAATNAIVEKTDVKNYCKIIGTNEDDNVQTIINAVSSLFENYCASKFINIALTEVIDGPGCEIAVVEYCPISALTEITYYFDTDSPVVQTITEFKFNAKAGLIRAVYTPFPEGWQNVQIKYTVGYGAAIANLPDDLKLAAIKQCEFYFKRDTADFSSTFEEGMVIKSPAEMLSPVVRDMLTPYFRVRL